MSCPTRSNLPGAPCAPFMATSPGRSATTSPSAISGIRPTQPVDRRGCDDVVLAVRRVQQPAIAQIRAGKESLDISRLDTRTLTVSPYRLGGIPAPAPPDTPGSVVPH